MESNPSTVDVFDRDTGKTHRYVDARAEHDGCGWIVVRDKASGVPVDVFRADRVRVEPEP